ncbi:hypothetical protein RBA41_01165 [Massilia sp. CCM 9210]|uniref:hypothetical protein n=1 Tax=Massilia scottii TaxID=3057166 RepID=UPI0027968457|nr:hypothetical protein [Massilia sp. CCM 9210]MDQ1811903.1 hypothetical protein [Massilia sp. CCM 9210]
MADFKPVACEPGSLLVLRAGQALNYGRDEEWDGWNVLFRPSACGGTLRTVASGG